MNPLDITKVNLRQYLARVSALELAALLEVAAAEVDTRGLDSMKPLRELIVEARAGRPGGALDNHQRAGYPNP